MKDGIIEKLTVIIETTNGNISKDVMESISKLQKTVASHKEIKLSMSLKEQHNPMDPYCPPNWNYWPM